ncbi:Sacsin [Mytilus edulis]|uniref:Sacsin n=1 Tax=Mytilus edulis TaxID=6550 RepID=A0A8S3PPH9_MYTED|nr:Sacsin [Mytilus edulis]
MMRVRFNETSSLLKQLQNIMGEYPDDIQILYELAQNAEDAKATAMKIMFDSRKIDPGGSYGKYLKSPALCVYNNSVLEEDDWDGIASVYLSHKENIAYKIGRYGQGFKSVFHITDSPVIISGHSVLVIDPFKENKECRRIELIEFEKKIGESGILTSFGLSRKIIREGRYNGTLFWFPLRTSDSPLSKIVYCRAKMEGTLELFKNEIHLVLLFLKYLTQIELWDSKGKLLYKTEMTFNVRQKYDSLCSMWQKIESGSRNTHSIAFNCTTRTIARPCMQSQSSQPWIVVHFYAGHSEMDKPLIALALDSEIACLPYVGVAFQWDITDITKSQSGRVFNFLPMPATNKTNLPIHVNANFALSQNRRHLKLSDGKSSDKFVQWNEAVVGKLLPMAYVKLVEHLIGHSIKKGNLENQIKMVYDCMPQHEVFDDSFWGRCVEEFYNRVKQLPVFLQSSTMGIGYAKILLYYAISQRFCQLRNIEYKHIPQLLGEVFCIHCHYDNGQLLSKQNPSPLDVQWIRKMWSIVINTDDKDDLRYFEKLPMIPQYNPGCSQIDSFYVLKGNYVLTGYEKNGFRNLPEKVLTILKSNGITNLDWNEVIESSNIIGKYINYPVYERIIELCKNKPHAKQLIQTYAGFRRDLWLSRKTTAISFGQKEDLVIRLNGILENYPRDHSILKEMIQNADDAGAKEIHIVYDMRNHSTNTVFENWKPLQGHALCLFNDAVFTNDDLEGIKRLGVGSKGDDKTKTGQFGIGFNSVYHITDAPCILALGPDAARVVAFVYWILTITISSINSDSVHTIHCSVQVSGVNDAKHKQSQFKEQLKIMNEKIKTSPSTIFTTEIVEFKYLVDVKFNSGLSSRWFIIQTLGFKDPQYIDQTLKESINKKEMIFIPRGGVAFKVSSLDNSSMNSRAFCLLPLPVETGLSFHVNGQFSIDMSRNKLWGSEENKSSDVRRIWNIELIRRCIAYSYAGGIAFLTKYFYEKDVAVLTRKYVDSLPLYLTTKNIFWKELVSYVFFYITKRQLFVYPVIKYEKKEIFSVLNWIRNNPQYEIKEAIQWVCRHNQNEIPILIDDLRCQFVSSSNVERLRNSFLALGMKLVSLPNTIKSSMMSACEHLNNNMDHNKDTCICVQSISSKAAIDFFKSLDFNDCSTSHKFDSVEQVKLCLEYCLRCDDIQEIIGVPLLLKNDESIDQPLFKILCNNTDFPPSPFDDIKWRKLLVKAGLISDVSESALLHFARRIEASLPTEELLSKLQHLLPELYYFMAKEKRISLSFIQQLSKVRFLVIERNESKYEDIHKSLNTNLRLTSFQETIPNDKIELVWTTADVLPRYAMPSDKKLLKKLKTIEEPNLNLSCNMQKYLFRIISLH